MRGAGEDERELVAAEPAGDVAAARDVGEHLGDTAQHSVAGQVAVGVVDALEPVEVDEQQSRWRRTLRGGDLVAEHLGERGTVGQRRERVTGGPRLEDRGELLDVARRRGGEHLVDDEVVSAAGRRLVSDQ